ncbi:MAG: hypothetical protein ACLFR1_04205 [Spirochaetia bacterium]
MNLYCPHCGTYVLSRQVKQSRIDEAIHDEVVYTVCCNCNYIFHSYVDLLDLQISGQVR